MLQNLRVRDQQRSQVLSGPLDRAFAGELAGGMRGVLDRVVGEAGNGRFGFDSPCGRYGLWTHPFDTPVADG